MEAVKGKCTFEEIGQEDFISGIHTLNLSGGIGRFLPAPGQGVTNLISWSLRSIELAKQAQSEDEKAQYSSDALMSSRRSLGCLVDWYLKRDGFYYCKDKPKNSHERAEILLKRGLVDNLTMRVLSRAIKKRNQTEHDYVVHSLEEVEDIVELIRRTNESLMNVSNPSYSPFIIGSLSYSCAIHDNGEDQYMFYGWNMANNNNCFLLNTIYQEPWMGIIIPISLSEVEIRRTFLKNTSCESLFEILEHVERQKDHLKKIFSDDMLIGIFKEIGIKD